MHETEYSELGYEQRAFLVKDHCQLRKIWFGTLGLGFTAVTDTDVMLQCRLSTRLFSDDNSEVSRGIDYDEHDHLIEHDLLHSNH